MFPPKKHAKIVTVPLNGWGILQICLRSLEYILRFQTKLVFKLSFGNFRIFLRLCSLFTIFAPQKTPKNYHWSLKGMRCPPKLLVLLKIHVRGFKKIVSKAIFVIIANIFQITFSSDSVFAPKAPNNRYRSFKWVWIMPFRVCIKIYDRFIS